MHGNDTPRLSRLTAILTQLQSKRTLSASHIANKFNISVRTVYRDIRALETAGVPVITEEGKGYRLMEGYKIPPVMFSEDEANALITAERVIAASKDESLIKEFSSAIQKIKAVIPYALKEKTESLEARIVVGRAFTNENKSKHLLNIQKALVEHKLLRIQYCDADNRASGREIEPFVIYCNANDEWILVAFCRLRKDFRAFRMDRMERLIVLDETFPPHSITLEQYVKKYYPK